MLGTYAVQDGTLTFVPRFPLSPGVTVRAVANLPDGRTVQRDFQAAATPPRAATYVEHVYPSASLLPANQLKFYVCFSAPMRKGEAWQHLRLLNASGAAVELPFVEIDEELWDRDLKRLTVLFDPGRIKRGVLPLEEVGPAIEEGGRYTLVVDRAWTDANGTRLREEFRKQFSVAPADREAVDPSRWRLTAPAAETREPLAVEFPKPMDHELLLRSLEVSGARGRLTGSITVDREERRWLFTPREPWAAGDYSLLIDSFLEDLAGNRVGRPFDVDTARQKLKPVPAQVSRRFRVSAP
jgi:hypothetical protein